MDAPSRLDGTVSGCFEVTLIDDPLSTGVAKVPVTTDL